MIAAGSRIRVKDDPSKIGSVTGATRQLNGRLYLGVEFDTGKSDFLLASRLEALSDLPDALRDLARGLLSAPADLGRMLTHLRLTGRLADIIYSMEATNTVFHAYQFKPVIKILNSAARGLLVADEVGLGKTIEAGLVWTELVARYNAHRLLVVCPKSLQEKWRLELRNRFGVLAQIVDADGLLETLKETRSTGGDFALIASLTAVRAPKGWEEADAPAQGGREALARYLDDNADADPLLDLVIFDEAHHLRNPETAQHKSARQLVAIADYKLMLSATPINLRSEDLRSLLRLLEPDIFDREWIFDELQQENAPIVAARERALTKACSLADLREAVADISVGRLLKTDRRLKILRDQLNSDVITDTPARRADIAARLEEMSLLGGLLNRTRRRDVAEIQIKRRAACRTWSMTYGERSFYDRASATIREYAYRNDINDGFLLSNTQRVLASSLAAAFLRWSRLETDLGTDEDGGDEEVDGVGPLVAALNRCCRDRSDYEALKAGDSKYTLFRTALDDTWKAAPEEKVIVFSSFRGTIDYLAERLKADGVPFEKLHGSIKDGRMDVLARFSKARGRCVLLSSEIGSEGLDLQFCRLLINYDLPWNPMRVEQRIGRIDRIGQVAPSVEIFSLICEATIEEKIYHRLYERLNLIERSLGGFEPILGDIIAELQDRLLDPSLSPEDVDREIERAVLSAETRKKHEEALEAEAPGLIAHGDMILQRIKRTHEQQGWIGAEELYEYARLGLQAAYPHSTLDRAPIEPVAYDLRLCAAGHDAFRKFLETSSRRYPTRLRRNALARVVFGKNTDALPEADVEVLHAGHPFIRFLGRVQDRGALAGAARPAVWGEADPRSQPPDLEAGRFGIVIQRWSTNGVSAQDKLVYAGLNLDSGTLLKPHQAEAVALQSVRNLRQAAPSADELARTVAMLETQLVGEHLRADSEAFFAAEEASHADKKETLVAVLRRQLESHREKAEARIAEYQAVGGAKARMIPAERGKIGKYVARMEAKIVEIESGRNFEFEEPVTVGVLVVEAGECRSLGSD